MKAYSIEDSKGVLVMEDGQLAVFSSLGAARSHITKADLAYSNPKLSIRVVDIIARE